MLTEDKDIIKDISNELSKSLTNLLHSYCNNNNLVVSGIVCVKYIYKFDAFIVDLTHVQYKYKNKFYNMFSKTNHKRKFMHMICSVLTMYKKNDYKAVVLLETDNNDVVFDMVKTPNQFIVHNFKKVLKAIKKSLPNNDEFECYADVVNNKTIDIVVQWKKQYAFSINISQHEMNIECFEAGSREKLNGIIVKYPAPCHMTYDDAIIYFMKFVKLYFNELENMKYFIFF